MKCLFPILIFFLLLSFVPEFSTAAVVCTVSAANQPGLSYPTCNLNIGDSAQITLKDGTKRTVTLLDVQKEVTEQLTPTCNFTFKAAATVDVDGEIVKMGVAMNQPYTIAKGIRMYALRSRIFNTDGDGECWFLGFPTDISLMLTDANYPPFDTSLYYHPFDKLWGLNFHAADESYSGRHHEAYDTGMPFDTKIYAQIDGKVWGFGPQYSGAIPENNGVQIGPVNSQYGTGGASYGHVKSLAPGISVGSSVQKGQWIANSGWDGGLPHTHWGVYGLGNDFPFIKETYTSTLLSQPKYQGYIKDWLVLGPFSDASSNRLLNDKLGGQESTIEPSENLVTSGRTWKFYDNLLPGVVDLASALSPAPWSNYAERAKDNYPNSVGYAHVFINSPATQNAQLWLGYNDGIRVWLNGNLLYTDNADYQYDTKASDDIIPDQAKIAVTLNAGWNRLLLKVNQDADDDLLDSWPPDNMWKFSVKLAADALGNLVQGLTLQTNSPGTIPPSPAPTPPPPSPTPLPPSPTPTPVTEVVLYDDGLQNGFKLNSWNDKHDPAYTAVVFDGPTSLQKNFSVDGGSGQFMAIYRDNGIFTGDYSHIDFYVRSLSLEGATLRVRFAVQPWQGTSEEVVITIPAGTWTRYSIPFTDFGSNVLDKQYVGIAFSGGGVFNDPDNNVVFEDIKLVKLPDTIHPQLTSVGTLGSNQINVVFNEKLDATSAANINNFLITSAADTNYLVAQKPILASLNPTQREVVLTLPFDLKDGITYKMRVSNVKDAGGNPITANAEISFTAALRKVNLSVGATANVHPFNSMIRGVATNNWNWLWSNLQPLTSPQRLALLEATKYIKPGIIRFAGGLWANGVGWDRLNSYPGNDPGADGTVWVYTDSDTGRQYDYRHVYKASMIDSYAAFAKVLGAETMIQVNICDNNPKIWADMVKYTNSEKGYNFKYWELGNEIELVPGDQSVADCFGSGFNLTNGPAEYARRFAAYSKAMKAIDPTIKIMGPVVHQPYRAESWFLPTFDGVVANGGNVDVLSWHWYPLNMPSGLATDPTSGWTYESGSLAGLLEYNKITGTTCVGTDAGTFCPGQPLPLTMVGSLQIYRRQQAEAIMKYITETMRPKYPVFETAITEFGVDCCEHEHPINGNHVGAIWLADMLGRFAYNGLDMITYYSLEDGGTGVGQSRGLAGVYDSAAVDIRPAYYTEFMYAQYFGDMMVQSLTDDPDKKVTIWASTDSRDPGKLKLMLVNLRGEVAASTITVSGFLAQSGSVYETTSTDPLSMDNPRSFTEHQTTINGIKIPDVSTSNLAAFTSAVTNIPSKTLSGITRTANGSTITYNLPPYSVVAVVLRSDTGKPGLPSSLDRDYIFLDRPTVLYLLGAGLEADKKFKLKLESEAGQEFEFEVEAKDAGSIELDLSKANLSLFIPGFYEIEIERESDGSTTTLSQRLLITKLGDLTRDGKVSILDVSLLLSRWNSILQADLDVADVNGPQGLPDGKIDIYDANKMMANWTGS
ncbi:MAG: hypothetical protein A2109_00010 [Candidatus Wildermuthbacteria bacterium GWA1_49_26]|nr:MAG: hypothetical protein A2109_00010 [Candidatus Wildermuthbacteria bacterium GWA1_49_26]OHA65193.1 MAG: hypothetical protein A2674_03305 [Candidatus Wildermuthbacteria bacterium RIFCSPHIGHO2_01_FULL_50_47]OHA69326.1 MAG: hypothetical protein A3D63_03770 [Candidatus Wildermuthbacteria bacterium RIFCSPHIGHO2_02_FULL_49_17]OHA74543.1 MAG: hypothetical protein A3B28_03930 [Candidatus Wildermuthbacteria bacterium RIFCSPLOWO2_01_FULL_50_46]